MQFHKKEHPSLLAHIGVIEQNYEHKKEFCIFIKVYS